MGCTQSKEIPPPDPGPAQSPAPPPPAERNPKQTVRLLLAGASECGKSTIFKQMRILYGEKKTEEELKKYSVYVRSNIITTITKLCKLIESLGLVKELDRESVIACAADPEDASGMTPRQAYDQIMTVNEGRAADRDQEEHPQQIFTEEQLKKIETDQATRKANREAVQFMQYVETIRILWQSGTRRRVWMQRSKANIHDSHKNYFLDLSRISSFDYIPTDQDILACRVRTTNPVVERYNINGVPFEVTDVGGHQRERYRWARKNCEPDAVIFVAALSDYDQMLTKPISKNRMQESLDLYEAVVREFGDLPIMLFLNKKDIFREKVQYSDIVSHFDDFAGRSRDRNHGVAYFLHKFQREFHKHKSRTEEFPHHVTCATDTNNMKAVLELSRTAIFEAMMRGL